MFCAGLFLLAAPTGAQQSGIRHSMAGGPVGPAQGWAMASAGTRTPSPAALVAQGPATRLAPAIDLTVFQPAWTAAGSFTVSALFERLPTNSSTAAYGVTLGTTEEARLALAFLVRADGSLWIQRGPGVDGRTRLASTIPARQRAAFEPEGTPARIDRLEVRVGGGQAEFFANGQTVAVVPIAPGELDGHAGLHASAGSTVLVSGFTLEGSITAVRR